LKRTTLIVIFLAITACQPAPRVDTSSEEALKASLDRVRESLSEDQRVRFDEAVNMLTFRERDLKEALIRGLTGRSGTEEDAMNPLHGKTGKEIIDEAGRILEERRRKEREQALGEISELEKKRTHSREAREQLDRFKVVRSRFYKEPVGFLGPQPFVELTVRNGTAQVISRVHFVGTVGSPDRSIPWLKERFSYRLERNLEPGEEETWLIPMNPFSSWGTTDIPDDGVLTVEVFELEGPGGKSLYSRRGFSDEDMRRLIMLKEKYNL